MHPKPYMGQKKPQSKNWSTEAAASLGRCTWAEPGQRCQREVGKQSDNSEEFILAKGMFKLNSNPHPHPAAQPLTPIPCSGLHSGTDDYLARFPSMAVEE